MSGRVQYGLEVVPYQGRHSIIGAVETAPIGNIILRAGRLTLHGWTQTEHIVLTPAEALALAQELVDLAGFDPIEGAAS